MFDPRHNDELPAIPGKRYFTIGEVSELCAVKPHVLRYWEQEFPQLSPVKRRGNRRYYQREDVELVRTIRSLLYSQGYTIGGAAAAVANWRLATRVKVCRLRAKNEGERMKSGSVQKRELEPSSDYEK